MTPFIAILSLWSCAAGETDQWSIQHTDGETSAASIQSWDAEMNLLLGDGSSLSGRKIVSLERIGSVRPAWPAEPQVAFVNGDRFVGSLEQGDQRVVLLNTSISSGAMKIPLSRVDRIWFAPPHGPLTPSTRDNPKRDQVTLRNGDRLSGTLSALVKGENLLKLEIDSKLKSIPVDQLVAIHLNSELRSDRVPEQPYWQCTLRNGSRISLLSIRVTNERLTGQTLFKADVLIPFGDIVALEQLQGKSIWLSSRKPARFDSTPYLGDVPPWQADRNASGMQLALRTSSGLQHFDRGLSMTSKSSLTYALDGHYEWFFAEVGLDPHLGKQGNVDVNVFVDGRAAALSALKGLTLKRGAVPVRLKLDGVKQLTLEIDWGEGGPVEDVVNWGQARLIKK